MVGPTSDRGGEQISQQPGQENEREPSGDRSEFFQDRTTGIAVTTFCESRGSRELSPLLLQPSVERNEWRRYPRGRGHRSSIL